MDILYFIYVVALMVAAVVLTPIGYDIGFSLGEWIDRRKDR